MATETATINVQALSKTALGPADLMLLWAIDQQESITGAANFLQVSQPALSQQIRRLERRLGLELVERNGRRMQLAPAGRSLAKHAETIQSVLQAAQDELTRFLELGTNRVTLLAFPSASPKLIPQLVTGLARTHPSLELSYIEAEPPEAVAAIKAGTADLALTFSYPGDPLDPHQASASGLVVEDVGIDQMLAVLPAGKVPNKQKEVALDQLAAENWIAGCPRCRGHLLQVCHAAGFTPKITFETDNVLAAASLVASGVGVALLPKMALAVAGMQPGLAYLPTTQKDQRRLHLVAKPALTKIPGVAIVMEQIKVAVAAQLETNTAAL